MTPFARQVYKLLLNRQAEADAKSRSAYTTMLGFFRKAVCFELSAVSDLVLETGATLAGRQREAALEAGIVLSEDFRINPLEGIDPELQDQLSGIGHGGLVFPPAEFFIIELDISQGAGYKAKVGFLCQSADDDQIGCHYFTNYNLQLATAAHFIEYDKEQYKIQPDNRIKGSVYEDYYDDVKMNESQTAVSLLAACLVVLNAPYGIARNTPQRHKGHFKEARKAGFELLPHHIITLDKTKAPPEAAIAGCGGSPKAFHFVRSHLRHYQTVKNVVVKAHWRGDPRLGIHQASYKVKAS